MDVNEPEILKRRMYDGSGEMAVERPVIEQDNDIDAPFALSTPSQIPTWLMDEIHRPLSVDPEPEAKEEIETPLDVEKFAEENPNSRFQLTNAAIHAPGTCILCKSDGGDGRQFLDLGIQITWVGALYFCTFCVQEAAVLIGFVRGLPKDEIIDGLNGVIEKNNIVIGELQEQLNASRVLLRNCHCGDSVPSYSDIVDVSVVEEVGDSTSDGIADNDESGGVEESGDISEASSDNEPEPEPEPVKRRGRRTASADE